MKRGRRKSHQHLLDYLIPHGGNGYRPGVFGAASVAIVLAVVLLLQVLFFAQTAFVTKNQSFLASVLPGALASLTNADRQIAGLSTLELDPELSVVAQRKAEDMAAKGYFSHTGPDGRQAWDWLSESGYSFGYAGENLAVNFSDSKEVAEAWMDSPTHRANILKAEYTHVGFGVAKGEYKGEEAVFVVQFFATKPQTAVAEVLPEPEAESLAAAQVEESPEEVVETVATEPVPQEEGPVTAAAEEVGEAVAVAATSPDSLLTHALVGLSLLVGLLFVIAIVVKLHVQHPGVIVGGFALLTIVIGAMYVNIVLDESDLEIAKEKIEVAS